MSIRSVEQLLQSIEAGGESGYLFFWGHRKPETGVTTTCFSQWYETAFVVDGVEYLTAEHCMMAGKAQLFGDEDMIPRILEARTPAIAKRLGRKVKGFDDRIWRERRSDIVVQANLAKFSQHQNLKDFLLTTGDAVIAEASPYDKIWGIGMSADAAQGRHPREWKGLNLLGFALMEVRDRLNH